LWWIDLRIFYLICYKHTFIVKWALNFWHVYIIVKVNKEGLDCGLYSCETVSSKVVSSTLEVRDSSVFMVEVNGCHKESVLVQDTGNVDDQVYPFWMVNSGWR
jgi:hypothetical protein